MKTLIIACMYLAVLVHRQGEALDPAMQEKNDRLVSVATRQFEDLQAICNSGPKLCQSVASLATSIGDEANARLQMLKR